MSMALPPTNVPSARVADVNDAPVRDDRDYVLHWITATRRLGSSFALDVSIDACRALGKPLVILEALRVAYPYASDRLHRFVLDGMADHVEECEGSRASYHAYVERRAGDGSGLVAALAARACLVVTDDYPTFFLPRMVEAAARKLDVRLVKVDGNGILPAKLVHADHASAYAYRREAQKLWPVQLAIVPRASPLDDLPDVRHAKLPTTITKRWPSESAASLRSATLLAELPLDRSVPIVEGVRGGPREAERVLARFVKSRLERYGERNHPDAHATSELSPYLHFGHVSAHAIVSAVVGARFDPARLAPNGGKREGYFGLDPAREAFLDQLLTWREIGFAYARLHADHDRYESLPTWARATLAKHAPDERQSVYDEATLEAGRTHDPVWNAAQRELRERGVIHNYMRMLWGKKILEWSASPEEAWRVMIRLNDRWALDGRDPSSYSGIGWVMGRFDRPWAPERAIYGRIRYMTSESAKRKLELEHYLVRFGDASTTF